MKHKRVRFTSILSHHNRSEEGHGGGGFMSSFRESLRNNHSTRVDPLYAEEKSLGVLFGGYTTPGPAEREASKQRKVIVCVSFLKLIPNFKGGGGHGSGAANLGVLLGVYLPTIQHILGVTMFIRLSWCVGVAGIGQTFLMLFICCLCVGFLWRGFVGLGYGKNCLINLRVFRHF